MNDHLGTPSSWLCPSLLTLLTVCAPCQTLVQLNGHYYEFVPAPGVTWQAASAAAAARTYLGTPGHLATVTYPAENSLLASLVSQTGFAGSWIAARSTPSGECSWTAGPESGLVFSQGQTPVAGGYANWGGIEPNNNPGFGYMNVGTSFAGIANGQWADDDDGTPGANDPVIGYFVEYSVVTMTSGRMMRVNAPALIGQTARFAMQHPVGAAGNLYLMVWSAPFAGVVPIAVPGLTVNGLVRVDLANAVSAASGVLTAHGMTPDLQVPIPSDPLLVGYAWDLQGVDLSSANVLTLAANDLPIVVTAPPLPGANMVAIAPGTFQMGSVAAGATPVHAVTISRPFWIGRDEVTQAQYQAVMGSNPSLFQGVSVPNAAQHPVEQVSWFDAMAYCAALSVQEAAAGRLPVGYEYRLPTEAEWEYCCRAGTTTEFHVGNSLSCSDANFSDNGACVPPGQTNAVGSYGANAYGLRDMHGNVWEWCLDAYTGYPPGPVTDPYVPSSSGLSRVVRGGSFDLNSSYCRSAFRSNSFPSPLNFNRGFRVVCAPVLP